MTSPARTLTICCLLATAGLPPAEAQVTAPPRQRQQARPANPAFAKVVDDPDLPRVLLIGDSISIGYTAPVRRLLAGQANVHRIPTNGGPTTRGLESLEEWLGTEDWDVIHFNWGLHDLKYIDDSGALVPPDQGRTQVPIDQYERNLRTLTERLRKTGATLIWRSTTPVPEGATGRNVGDAARYNEVAARIMQDFQIPIDDHYAYCLPRLSELQRPANVHFTPEGSEKLAELTAKSIQTALQQRAEK